MFFYRPQMKEPINRNWETLILESDTTVARELLRTYEAGNMQELGKALKLHYENSIAGAELELATHLYHLMENILLITFSEDYRTQEHWEKICRLRTDVEEDLEYNDCLTEESIKAEWEFAWKDAKDQASIFVKDISMTEKLTWKDVFETTYHPSQYGK